MASKWIEKKIDKRLGFILKDLNMDIPVDDSYYDLEDEEEENDWGYSWSEWSGKYNFILAHVMDKLIEIGCTYKDRKIVDIYDDAGNLYLVLECKCEAHNYEDCKCVYDEDEDEDYDCENKIELFLGFEYYSYVFNNDILEPLNEVLKNIKYKV